MSSARLRAAVCLWVAVHAAACAGGFRSRTDVPEALRVGVVAVYPFGFRWSVPAYRSFELSVRLIDPVLEGVGYHAVVFGPGEFQLYRPEDDNVYAATGLGQLLPGLQLRPSRVAVLRPWAEKRVHSSSKTLLDSKGRPVGVERQEETKYVGHVEVIHAATGKRLIELSGEVVADPFAEREDEGADPAPELTALMLELVAEAVAQIEPHLFAPGLSELPEGYAFALAPQAALTYEEPGRPSMAKALARMDALDRELLLRSRARFANPGLEDAALAPLVTSQGGLYVREAPEGGPLAQGDLVMKVNGAPALPHVWVRARLLEGPDTLRVRKADGAFKDLRLD